MWSDDGHMRERTDWASHWRADRHQGGPWTHEPEGGGLRPRGGRPGRPPFWRFGPGRWSRGPGSGAPLRRGREDRLAGGVASALAARTGFDVTVVRLVFVLVTVASSGLGAVGYV